MAVISPAPALQPPRAGRFDPLVIHDPSVRLGPDTQPLESLESLSPLRTAWEQLEEAGSGRWQITLDGRTGVPLLVLASGLALPEGESTSGTDHVRARWDELGRADTPGGAASAQTAAQQGSPGADGMLISLERSVRAFLRGHGSLLKARDDELALNRAASLRLAGDLWQITFDHEIGGIPVLGDRYIFYVTSKQIVAFGATRWASIASPVSPAISAAEASERLHGYMGLKSTDTIAWVEPGRLVYLPMPADAARLAWRMSLRVEGERGHWVGMVDALDGTILAFYDDDKYAQVRGGVYPLSNDQICPDGCEQPGRPMPFADVAVGGVPGAAGAMGVFDCSPNGSSAGTALRGPAVAMQDTCGTLLQSVVCDGDIDLREGPGTDCDVPAGSSAGNTHAARTGFYHLNRIIEKAKAWLPDNSWLGRSLPANVNLIETCNAFWDGDSVNFYRSGGGCRNSGELAPIILHEWAHGLDQNDGGGFDNPPEAYADVTAILHTRSSCMGRGFYQTGTCSGYGNACLTCTGTRDLDWDKRADRLPSTPSGFIAPRCPAGNGPCGRQIHCEGYVAAEALWDLAVRDLPAAGLDAATAWAVAERLWYLSRRGSGGPAYNCSLPSSDGCGPTSWFTRLRLIDDDDADLTNGTPHAGAIFAAFARHGIACGAASDPSNQSQTICPPLAAPALTAAGGAGSASLSWTAVPAAASYIVFRSDTGCSASPTPIATLPATTFTDTDLPDGATLYYSVQAAGANAACRGPVSNCAPATPHPFAGSVALDRSITSCAATIQIQVRDGNIAGPTATVTAVTETEPAGETVVLTRSAPASSLYTGSIATVSGPPAPDGRISLSHGDTLAVTYLDANDGQGGANLPRRATALADCRPPVISAVRSTDITGQGAVIRWSTDEAADSAVDYASLPPAPPASGSASSSALVTEHAVALGGLGECTTYSYEVSSADPAGNRATDGGGGAGYEFRTVRNTRPVHASVDTPLPIPDNDPAGATSAIAVADNRTVLDVDVGVNITHTYVGDLILRLVAPSGAVITLAERRGGSGRNYTGTVFDDDVAVGIAAGTAPFTGSFRPETPLSAADGIPASGEWRLRVIDQAVVDVGTIDSWTLRLTFADAVCDAHARYAAHTLVQDDCLSGGAGDRNGRWEGGERVRFRVRVENDGTELLSGVRARVVPLTAGVIMDVALADYGTLPPGAATESLPPHYAARLPLAPACGDGLSFRVEIESDQGSWTSTFSQVIGEPLTRTLKPILERFDGGIPASWTVVNGGTGGGTASTWTTNNPGGRIFTPPLAHPVAIVDSDKASLSATQDEQLITPPLDLLAATSVVLEFDQYFRWYSGSRDEKGDVDVRSNRTSGAWVNVLRNQGRSTRDPDSQRLDISVYAAWARDVQIRFHYYDANFEYWWMVDNVIVTITEPAGCAEVECIEPLPPPPAPDGRVGAPMRAVRLDAAGSSIRLLWDAVTCPAPGYHLLYGNLAQVSSYALAGGACGLGASGTANWTGVPPGNLWFLLVSDNQRLEGTWGNDSSGAPRAGTTPSGLCDMAGRENGAACGAATP